MELATFYHEKSTPPPGQPNEKWNGTFMCVLYCNARMCIVYCSTYICVLYCNARMCIVYCSTYMCVL